MSVVNQFYQDNREFSEDDLLNAIINTTELTAEDLWLLPQYVFDEWRKKHDYPRILDNFKRRLIRFEEWKKLYSLTDEILMDGYLSNFIQQKYVEDEIDLKFYLIKVTYQGKTKHQVWYSYDKDELYNQEEITYDYICSFLSYFDWCQIQKIKNIEINIERINQASDQELVYYNFDLRLLKMGGIEPPKNGFRQILRPKKMEFVNASGLKLTDEIRNNQSIEFIFSTVDNMICRHLKVVFLTFDNSSVRNLNIENSNISNWKFINSNTSGIIKNSSIKNVRIWGGQFVPVFENTEPENFGVWHSNFKNSKNFDRTYRALYKANNEIGNYKEANKFKILEMDYKRKTAIGFWNKVSWNIDKYFWGYGREPRKIIVFSLISMATFAIPILLIPNQIIPIEKYKTLDNFEIFCYCYYYSATTFMTMGFSDISPLSIMSKLIVATEALLGFLSMGALIVTLTKTKE